MPGRSLYISTAARVDGLIGYFYATANDVSASVHFAGLFTLLRIAFSHKLSSQLYVDLALFFCVALASIYPSSVSTEM